MVNCCGCVWPVFKIKKVDVVPWLQRVDGVPRGRWESWLLGVGCMLLAREKRLCWVILSVILGHVFQVSSGDGDSLSFVRKRWMSCPRWYEWMWHTVWVGGIAESSMEADVTSALRAGDVSGGGCRDIAWPSLTGFV